ncbi:MAG: FtsX-like permease family protein [Gemmatimonadetes bacterium]|nr:FtsX-like permease family protein [Gemmatimonadota bacterium]MYF18420.1 FtsX-like permease family protein [Gemmatimonadota bacterium]
MIKNYLTIATRNLMRHKLYTSINVLGLAIGLACGILILLYIQQEFAIDRSHTLGDRIYKVIREERGSTQTTYDEGTSGALGPVLKETFPEVETTVRIWRWGVSAKYGDHKNLYTLALIDDNFLDVFDFPLIKGDLETAFRLPYSAVITDDMAQHLFGDMDPMGKTVSVDNRNFPGEYTVTGIVKAPHLLSDLQFHLLTTTIPSVEETQETWTMWRSTQSWRPVRTYVLLKAGQNAETLQTKMQPLIVQYMGDDVAKKNTYYLQPLHRVYLYGESDFNPAANSPIQQIYMLAAIGLILVVIACVNFTNLATARAVTRKREVGVRKVVGAHRPQLIVQFLTESLLLTCAALLIALALVELCLPLFNQFVRGDLHLDAIMVMAGAPAVLALTLVVGLLAGWYPAFFLSSFRPVTALKSSASSSPGSTGLRKGLVVFQFGMSILLVICTLVVYQQLRFTETKDLGFARDHIVSVPIFAHDREHESVPQKRLSARHQMVKQVFLEHPNILSASALRYAISGYGGRPRLIWPDGDRTKEQTIRINEVDDSFFETFDIPVLRGRAFSADVASDTSQAIILNETAVRLLGWEDDPIGKQIVRSSGNRSLTVIGVVKDYHGLTLREEIAPMGFVGEWDLFVWLALRIRPEETAQTLSFLETQWKRFVPEEPFAYHFLDEIIQWYYFDEHLTGKMLGVFSLLAIFVACLGLFGLAAFMVQSRTKEIGVRKVLGASTPHLVMLLSREFMLLILLANLIAWPIAYYLMRDWLSGFAYQTDLNVLPFIASAIMALIIAFGTVSMQAIRAARSNPIDALRYE